MMKDIELLDHLLSTEAGAILRARVEAHARFASIDFKVLEVKESQPPQIVLRITQDKSHAGNYFDNKRLSEIGQELFDGLGDWKIITRPIPYKEHPTDVVTAEWITNQIKEKSVKLTDLAIALGIDANNLSAYKNGLKPISGPVKAALFYYFKSK